MELKAFEKCMAKMAEVYGGSAYPVERQKLIYQALQRCPDSEFEELTSHLIANNRMPPLLKEFLTAANELSEIRKKAKEVLDRGSMTKGLRISTFLSCDRCFRRFEWRGYVPDIEDERLCADCNYGLGSFPKEVVIRESPN